MISQLGVTSNVLPFKVTLRLGNSAESQTIPVRDIPPIQPAK